MSINANLATEKTNRKDADSTLTANLATEMTNRADSEETIKVNLASEIGRAKGVEGAKEDVANKSTATSLGTSDVLYPTQNAVKTYVDSVATNSGTHYVDLTNNQTIAGVKTFSSDIKVNGLTFGKGAGSQTSNTAIGVSALSSNSSGFYNTAVGASSLTSNTTGYYNTAVGFSALTTNTTGTFNTAMGSVALINNTTGTYNTGIGTLTLNSNTTGSSNTAIGASALHDNSTGGDNTAIGKYTLAFNTIGYSNTATGVNALTANTEGSANTANGYNALHENTIGILNNSNGYYAMYSNTSGSENTATGSYAMRSNTTGAYNTAIGNYALQSNTTGTYNTAIGYSASVYYNNLTNATAIGYNAKVDASNKIQLGNSAVTSVNTSGNITAKSFVKSGGTSSQYLMADGSVTTGPAIPKTFEALGITLSASYSGTIIYSQNGANPSFPEDLPDGFNCVIVNYSNFTFTSNTLSTAKFYSKTTGNTGASTFSLPSGGTAQVNVVSISGAKHYYISGDVN